MTLRASLVAVLRVSFNVALLVIGLEVVLRVVHQGVRPMLPHQLEDGRVASLPADAELWVGFSGQKATRYVTDAAGARVATRAVRDRPAAGDVVVVGDSQMLGWGLSFEETFASALSAGLLGDGQRSRIVAAARSDPETSAIRLATYVDHHTEVHEACVVALNLGNDLEELYLNRTSVYGRGGDLREWLTLRSFAFLDLAVLREKFRSGEHIGLGTNGVVSQLSASERSVLAAAVVRALSRTLESCPPSGRRGVVIIPNDSQMAISEFEKYRPFYRDEVSFRAARAAMPETVRRMDEIEKQILDGLDRDQIPFATLDQRTEDRALAHYDRQSHHLTAAGNASLAEGLIAVWETR